MTTSWQQYKLECQTVAKEGVTILGFVEPWNGGKTKLVCRCKTHGEWKTTSIWNFRNGRSCPKCKTELLKSKSRGEDSLHISDFLKTGSFILGTKFFRSVREDRKDFRSYWDYTCPVCSHDEYVQAGLCSGIFKSSIDKLKRGSLSCRCSKHYYFSKEQWDYRLKKECDKKDYTFLGWKSDKFGSDRKFCYECLLHGKKEMISRDFLQGKGCPECSGRDQQECYLNAVYDGKILTALKFGIATDSKNRLRIQNRANLFKMKQICVYTFNSFENCCEAEKACMKELSCRILTKIELKDGWTETTSVQNLDKIIEIYERFGGVKVK